MRLAQQTRCQASGRPCVPQWAYGGMHRSDKLTFTPAGTVCLQACQECQELLLRLHNLCSHPALSTCLSDGHHAAVAAAIKPWASALLKLRCSPTAAAARSSAGGACAARQASTGAACGRGCSDVGCPSEPGGGFEPGAVAVQEHRWGGCRQHLVAAAAQSLGLMQKVRTA